MKERIYVRFEPKEDITPFELAQILKLTIFISQEQIGHVPCTPDDVGNVPSVKLLNSFGENVKRHLIFE